MKKGCAFRNIGFKYTQFSTVKSALLLFRFYILSLIRSFTIGDIGTGTSFFVTVVFAKILNLVEHCLIFGMGRGV